MSDAPSDTAGEPAPITTKEQLVATLKEAAQLEHEFMCQYLYAAFSLKKGPDATCNAAQFEAVRRWASTNYMIARQEMEHLSIANSLLTAIGAAPVYDHGNFPSLAPWYTQDALAHKQTADSGAPCPLPFSLEPFGLTTVRRFTCMESPRLDDVPIADQETISAWCFTNPDSDGDCRDCGCVEPTIATPKTARPTRMQRAEIDVEIGTVQALYAAIRQGFIDVQASIGHTALFDGHTSGQQEIPSEYNIYLFPICDLQSSLAGIDLIIKQGEGLDAPPLFESHFMGWYQMAREYQALVDADPAFQPAHPLPSNPTPATYAGDPDAAVLSQMVDVYNQGYVTLLYMLAGYNTNFRVSSWTAKPFLSAALEQIAFAPMMTMLVRSLAEVITQMPWQGGRAGPTFYISDADRVLLDDPNAPELRSLAFYFARVTQIVDGLQAVLDADPPAPLVPKLTFILQNMIRVRGNLNYVYVHNVFPNFDPATDLSCPPSDKCGA